MKNKISKCVFGFLFLFSISNVEGQSMIAENLRWSAVKFLDHSTTETTSHNSSFETSSEKILWIQRGGKLVYEFTISGSEGIWPDVSVNGQLVFFVEFKGNKGTVKFSRENELITIKPEILVEGTNMLPYTFTINSITKL